MKKILFILGILLLCACQPIAEKVEKHTVTYRGDRTDRRRVELHNTVNFEYENHEYILFITSYGDVAIVHNPDCHCFN